MNQKKIYHSPDDATASSGLSLVIVVHCSQRAAIVVVIPIKTLVRSIIVLKRRTDAESECTEDRQDGRVGATEYAERNRTRKRGGDAERIT